MANDTINGKECTTIWHVDDLKISHIKDVELYRIIADIDKVFVQESLLTTEQGAMHNYLGMNLEYSNSGKIMITMFDYIQGIMDDVAKMLKTRLVTPITNHLFET